MHTLHSLWSFFWAVLFSPVQCTVRLVFDGLIQTGSFYYQQEPLDKWRPRQPPVVDKQEVKILSVSCVSCQKSEMQVCIDRLHTPVLTQTGLVTVLADGSTLRCVPASTPFAPRRVADVMLRTHNFLLCVILCKASVRPHEARRCRFQPCDEVRVPAVVLPSLVANQAATFAYILVPV